MLATWGCATFPKPTLDLDFSGATSLDSRITFTRASTATYFNSAGVLTSAAIDEPRFDYNPSTLAPQGLLIESQRTNSFPASNDFANATYWTVYGTAVATAGAGTGPDGLNSAVNLTGATDITVSGNNIEESVSVSASAAYQFSVFVKSNGGTTVTLRLRDSTGGSTTSTPFTVTSSWTRISLNRTMAVGATSVRCIIGATDGDILIYGAQLEAGAFATSYIPTTTTALTRETDIATMSGANFSSWYNAGSGTLFAEGTVVNNISGTTARTYAELGNAAGTERLNIEARSSTATRARSLTGGATVTATVVYNALGINAKVIGAYGSDGITATAGGLTPATAASNIPAPDTLYLGTNFTATAAGTLNGTLRRITYYPFRLPDAQLQALTGT